MKETTWLWILLAIVIAGIIAAVAIPNIVYSVGGV